VSSLEEMLDLGLNHEALLPILRRSTAPEERETDAYHEALAKREPLRRAVQATMESHSLDALVYPTIRTVPSTVGEPQRGSNCQLSAASGLPAISFPAGWSDGLPVGIELLGRAFDDARLVAIAFAFEQATGNRRAPAAAPPLREGRPPTPATVTARATGSGTPPVRAEARFAYDPVAGTLTYDVRVADAAPADVYAVVLRHTDPDDGASVVARLTGPGVTADHGTLALDAGLRELLEAGDLELLLVTRGDPAGAPGERVVIQQ
jgi:amidase